MKLFNFLFIILGMFPFLCFSGELDLTVDSFLKKYHSFMEGKSSLEQHDKDCAILTSSSEDGDIEISKLKKYRLGNEGVMTGCGGSAFVYLKDENLNDVIESAGILYQSSRGGLPQFLLTARVHLIKAVIGSDNYKDNSIPYVMSVPGIRRDKSRITYVDGYEIKNMQINDSMQMMVVTKQ